MCIVHALCPAGGSAVRGTANDRSLLRYSLKRIFGTGRKKMVNLFVKEYNGDPFVLFGRPHLAALGLVAALNLGFVVVRLARGKHEYPLVRASLAAVLLANEFTWHAWNWHYRQWSIDTMLPLHLCSLNIFLSSIMLLTRSYRLYEIIYFTGIGGALQALLTPDLGIHGYPHYRFFQTFISHGALVSAALYMTLVEGYRPTWGSVKRVIIIMPGYMALVGVVNWLTGGNYLFLARKPSFPTLLDLLGPWPWYILGVIGIGVTVISALYIPFALWDWLRGETGAGQNKAAPDTTAEGDHPERS